MEPYPRLEAWKSALQQFRGKGVAAAEEDLAMAVESDRIFTVFCASPGKGGQTLVVFIDRATGALLDSLDLGHEQSE